MTGAPRVEPKSPIKRLRVERGRDSTEDEYRIPTSSRVVLPSSSTTVVRHSKRMKTTDPYTHDGFTGEKQSINV